MYNLNIVEFFKFIKENLGLLSLIILWTLYYTFLSNKFLSIELMPAFLLIAWAKMNIFDLSGIAKIIEDNLFAFYTGAILELNNIFIDKMMYWWIIMPLMIFSLFFETYVKIDEDIKIRNEQK